MGSGLQDQGRPLAVTLDWYEVSRAALVGVSRNVEAIRLGCSNRLKAGEDWSIHILGALGECAFAKATGRYWSGGVNTFHGADIGRRLQVRTRSKHEYDLIVRADDADEDVFVLVTGSQDRFLVHGWVLGGEAKREEWIANHGNYSPAWFVPSSALNPISELPDGI